VARSRPSPGDFALGLHQPRETRRCDGEGKFDAAAEYLSAGVDLGNVASRGRGTRRFTAIT